MVRRRAKAARIATATGNHSFRGTGIKAYLKNVCMLEKAAAMANHGNPPVKTASRFGSDGDEDLSALSVPRQQLVKLADRMLSDPSEHIREPSLGIHVVQPGCLGQRIEHRRALAAAI